MATKPGTSPVPGVPGVDEKHWWCKLAKARTEAWARERGLRLPGWRALTAAAAAHAERMDEDRVRRCVLGENVPWDVAGAVSKVLEIEPPGVYRVFANEDEAAQFFKTSTGVPEQADLLRELRSLLDQARGVHSPDEPAPSRGRRPGPRDPDARPRGR
jgi:hypothetical protein